MSRNLGGTSRNTSGTWALTASLALAIAWLLPLSWPSAALAWLAALLFSYSLCQAKRPSYLEYFMVGCLTHSIAFYWLGLTIHDISKLQTPYVIAFFSLFIFLHALQFPFFLFIFNWLPKCFDRFALRSASAWIAIESLPIRLFPWHLGDTQIEFTWLAQIAEIGGVTLISFLIFWIAEASTLLLVRKGKRSIIYLPLFALLASCIFGYVQIQKFSSITGNYLDVALIQYDRNNTPEGQKLSPTDVISRLVGLTEDSQVTPQLAIWPESILPYTMHESVFDRKNDPLLPRFSKSFYLLTGSHTYRYPNKTFNSAVLIEPDGEVPLPYHKQVLIPFGEYTPFERSLPWLRAVHPISTKLTTGDKPGIFEIALTKAGETTKISPLICYEDLLPRLARSAVFAGAEILISLSNDAWLKRWGTVALYQHQMIAAFRSIENRRALLRVGNTGLTSITNPAGEIISSLPTHLNMALTGRIPLLSYKTFYNRAPIEEGWIALAGILILMSFWRWLTKKGRKR